MSVEDNRGGVKEGKLFQRDRNTGVNFFLARVKCVPKFTLFFCTSELCCNFALFGVLPKLLTFDIKRVIFLFIT